MRKVRIDPYLIVSAIVSIIYTYLIIWLIPAWSYFLNPDGYSYLTIALKFKSLNLHNMFLAINGLWGPIFPIVATFFLGISNYIKAIKLANAFTGILSLLAFIKLMQRFNVKPLYAFLLSSLAITSSVALSLTIVAPDQLLVVFLLCYTYILFGDRYFLNYRRAITCGVFGFLAYLTKQYAFYFFLLHFTLVNFVLLRIYWKTEYKKQLIRSYIYGMGIFLILSLFWTGVLSYRYKTFTVESSSKINILLLLKSKQNDSILTDNGLIPPPNSTAVNAWEDPTSLLNNTRGEFMSATKYSQLVLSNITKIYFSESGFILSLLVLALFGIFLKYHLGDTTLKQKYILLFISYLVFPIGYIFLRVEFRYMLYMYYIVLTMLGILLSSDYFQRLRLVVKAVIIIVIACAIFKPISTIDGRYFNKELFLTINVLSQIKNEFLPGDSFASNSNYFGATALAYQLKGQYFGQIQQNATPEYIEEQLNTYRIKYYVIWPDMGASYVPNGYPIRVTYADSDKTMMLLIQRY